MEFRLAIILGLMALFLLSGCATETRENDVETQDNTGDVEPDLDNSEEEYYENDYENDYEPTDVSYGEKLEAPYRCDDPVIQSNFEQLGQGTEVSRRLPPFGKTINFVLCKVTRSGKTLMQFEIHEMNTFELALESLEDEARQYLNQIPDMTKQTEDIGYKAYSFYSQGTKERRLIFLDDDRREKILVKINSTPGEEIDASILKQAARILERLI